MEERGVATVLPEGPKGSVADLRGRVSEEGDGGGGTGGGARAGQPRPAPPFPGPRRLRGHLLMIVMMIVIP